MLAVGDAAFQQKCLGKMGDAARHGRTILFVSHNMTAVRSLCRRVLLLDGGRIVMDGDVDACINRYLAHATASGANSVDVSAIHARHGYGGVRFHRITMSGTGNQAVVSAGHRIDVDLSVGVETAVNDIGSAWRSKRPRRSPVRVSERRDAGRMQPGAGCIG